MTSSLRTASAPLMVGLVASLLAVVPSTSASVASAQTDATIARASADAMASSISPSDPMPGEQITWTAPTGLPRKAVDVQYLDGATWTTLRSYRTDSSGVAVVTIYGRAVGTVTKYRLRHKEKTLLRRKITTVEQTVTLADPIDIGGNQVALVATYTPARRGRRGGLVADGGTGATHWDSQNPNGQITFRVTRPGTGGALTFRAFAYPRKGAPGSGYSNPQTVTSLN